MQPQHLVVPSVQSQHLKVPLVCSELMMVASGQLKHLKVASQPQYLVVPSVQPQHQLQHVVVPSVQPQHLKVLLVRSELMVVASVRNQQKVVILVCHRHLVAA